MKKITIFITILFIYISNSFAYMPINLSDIIIWKIDKIGQFKDQVNWIWYEFNFKNYINYKIDNNSLETLKYRNKLLNKSIVIFNQQLPINSELKKWDIVVVSRYSWRDWVLKIWCKGNLMYIEGKKNKVFLTAFKNWRNRIYINEVDKYENWIELWVLKKIYEKVWECNWLETFFEKDRTFEDLDWNDLKKYFYLSLFGILFIIILFIIIFKILKK